MGYSPLLESVLETAEQYAIEHQYGFVGTEVLLLSLLSRLPGEVETWLRVKAIIDDDQQIKIAAKNPQLTVNARETVHAMRVQALSTGECSAKDLLQFLSATPKFKSYKILHRLNTATDIGMLFGPTAAREYEEIKRMCDCDPHNLLMFGCRCGGG